MKVFKTSINSYLLRPLQGGGSFFVFSYLLVLLMLLPVWLVAAPVTKVGLMSFAEAFADAYIWAWILSFLRIGWRHAFQTVSIGVLLSASIADSFVKLHFHSFFSPVMVRLMLDTRSDEVWSFMISYVFTFKTFLIAAVFVAWAFTWWSYCRYWKRLSAHLRRLPVTFYGSLVSLVLLVGGVGMLPIKARTYFVLSQKTLSDLEVRYGDEEILSLYSPVHRIGFAVRSVQLAKHQILGVRETHRTLSAERTKDAVPIVVLIIGESYNRAHSELYGYGLSTTPHQIARKEKGELYAFTDVISCWNLTSYVFQHIFSLHSVDSPDPWESYPLFPAIYQCAGYDVTFLSSQFPYHNSGNISEFAGSFFLNDQELNRQMFDWRNTEVNQPIDDMELLLKYDQIVSGQVPAMLTKSGRPNPYQLTIFSLIGMHFNYSDRIPDESWNLFKESDYSDKNLSVENSQILADYDNATRYNDYVVDEILQRMENKNAVVVYCPDHGEELFDGTGVWGRTYPDVFSKAEMHNQFQIPFWIWCSDTFRASYPQQMERIRRAQDLPFMTDDLPHLLLDLSGVTCDYFDAKRSILSDTYHAGRKRMLRASQVYEP